MGKKVVYDPKVSKARCAKQCMEEVLNFKSQIKFHSDTEDYYTDHRILSHYNLQQFRDYLQTKVKDIDI